MRINRRFLYWGIFLVSIGAVLVAADVGGLDSGTIADGLRLWPVALVAIGVAIVIRRTRFGLPGGMLAAALPGLMIGGGFAIGPRIAFDCGGTGAATTVAAHDGVFDGPADVAIVAGCGALDVSTAPGSAWHLDDGSAAGRTAHIDSTSRSLAIDSGRTNGWFQRIGRDRWNLTLPTSPIDDLSIVLNAGQGWIALPGAAIGNLAMTSNAASTTVDLSEATVRSLSAKVNAGRLAFSLAPEADIAGSLDVNAGQLEVCVPGELGVRVHHSGALSGFTVDGQHKSGATWQSSNYGSAAHRADFDVDVNFGNVAINPIGGCK